MGDVFRSLDPPDPEEVAELQEMMTVLPMTKRQRELAVVIQAQGVCWFCEAPVGIRSLMAWPNKADGTMKALCGMCRKVINKDPYLIEYAKAAHAKWRDRIMYEARERLKAKGQKKRWKALSAKKRREAKRKT